MGQDSVRVRAWAKVNLCLSVGPPVLEPPERRGWHPIASWIHAIDLADTIVIRRGARGGGARFTRRWGHAGGPVGWPLEHDLAFRALRLVEEAAGERLDAEVEVEKCIPAGGGLGGGSSDAAAVMRGLNALLGLGISLDRLAEIGARLGSDVRFFLDEADPPRPALVTGLGDRVERLRTAPGWVVLAAPPFACSTPEVYRAYDRLGPGPLREEEVRSVASRGRPEAGALFNDLAASAMAVEPRLRAVIEAVRGAVGAAGGPVHMTGSGSTLFVVADQAQAGAWAAAVSRTGVARGVAARLV